MVYILNHVLEDEAIEVATIDNPLAIQAHIAKIHRKEEVMEKKRYTEKKILIAAFIIITALVGIIATITIGEMSRLNNVEQNHIARIGNNLLYAKID